MAPPPPCAFCAIAREVPHLHVHVHARRLGDGLLRVYPAPPAYPERVALDAWAARIRDVLDASDAPTT